ncbi:hypothetical protein MAMC_01991 [Methylacidimicrobium cyclopophantes]|uniref:Uncharacterized protein n=1 Tax=Methylacidimicrobium cyclopophantes TaxID=1041766 RepID=A0A5E6MII1_9BACT|nr:hypothetical protein [Methylacidimicrobium cyclopophantes]VVM08148.1 hypothetical protein MAMC_01991 [Methylacidimicrobium cyclopophantes]
MGRRELVLAGCLALGILLGNGGLRAGDHPAANEQGPEGGSWEMRQKIVPLLELPDDRLLEELQKWPRFQKMNLEQKGRLLERIARMRVERVRAAEREAKRLGLTLSEDQRAAFQRQYWQRREEMIRQLWKETEGRRKALREQLDKELKTEFATKREQGSTEANAGAGALRP